MEATTLCLLFNKLHLFSLTQQNGVIPQRFLIPVNIIPSIDKKSKKNFLKCTYICAALDWISVVDFDDSQ